MLEIVEEGATLTVKPAESTFVLDRPLVALAALPVLSFLLYWILTSDAGAGAFLFFWAFVVAAYFLTKVIFRTELELRINRDGRTISFRRRGLFSYQYRLVSFDELATAPLVRQIEDARTLQYEIFCITKNGERLILCDNQSDTFQLDEVAKWLAASVPDLPPAPDEAGILQLNS